MILAGLIEPSLRWTSLGGTSIEWSRTFEDVVEHVLAGGVLVRPQTSAALRSDGPAACVVARGTVPDRETAGPSLLLARAAAIPRRRRQEDSTS